MSEYRDALQPLTQSASARQSTKILKELAPQLLHPRILTSAAFLNGPASSSSTLSAGASSSSSSSSNTSRSLISLSNPQNAFVALARLRNNPLIQAAYSSDGRHGSASANGRSKGKGPSAPRTSTDLHILEGIDRLLDLPVPPMSLSTVPEEGDGEGENEDNETETAVSLFEGFRATIPSASSRKLARRRKRAGISERALGITAGADELGLRERGQRAAASSTSAGETSGGLGLLSAGDEYTVDSIESTPRRRTIKAKRRSSFMPSLASKQQQQQQQQQARKEHDIAGEPIETLTRPELESDLKEINMDKDALKVRRRLVVRDLEVLEAKIKKLEDIKLELGNKLLELKEEELELDDELEGVTDRLSQLEAINAGRVVSSTSSRRRKGPAFLPSEHDDLPANVAFMSIATAAAARAGTRAGASSKADYMSSQSSSSGPTAAPAILALDFSEPYGLLVASTAPRYASQASSSSVSVFDLTDGEELARLHGHRGGVKCLLVEGDLCITGGRDGTIAIWDLPAAVEGGMERERERERDRLRRESDRRQGKNRVKASSAASDISSQRSAGRDGDGDEDVFSASSAGKLNGQKASVNGDVAEREDYLSSMDGDKADEEEDEWPLLPSPGAALRSYRAMQMQQQQQQHHLAQASQTPTSRPPLVGHGQYSETRQEQQDEDEELDEPDGSVPSASRLRVLEGHSKDVTCISYEDNSLVSGSSDKTLRLWDMTTGQCVVTMDILWAISNPLPAESEEDFGVGPGGMAGHGHGRAATAASAEPASYNASGFDSPGKEGGNPSYPWHASSSYMTPRTKRSSLSGLRRLSSQSYGLSSMTGSPMTPTAVHPGTAFLPGSGGGGGAPTPSLFPGEDAWDTGYDDFVGGIQLWSYALASGSADGCVRMWDTRTGQSVRSLVGHTSAVTCLQFDNFHLVSGARDRSVRVWDLRTGRTIDTLRYPGRVTDLQFDTRRILVANDASNAVSVYNRTTLQQTELAVNGHAGPVEKLRFMDRYLATGGQDGLVKIWSLA